MEVASLSQFTDYLEKQSFAKETISALLGSWGRTGELKQLIEAGTVSLTDQDDGTILFKIGYEKYLIFFENFYRQVGKDYYKELLLRISFAKEILNKNDRSITYNPIGGTLFLDSSDFLFDENGRYFNDKYTPFHRVLLAIFAGLVMEEAEMHV